MKIVSQNQNAKNYERKVTSAELFFSSSPYSIVTLVARIKGNVTSEMLKHAVGKAQQRHALLRVRIREEADHTQLFTSQGVQENSVKTYPRNSETDWIRIHAEEAKIPFEFETHPAIRFILVHSPEISELIILCHHIICDGMSLAYLARDLMVHLGDPAREVDVLPPPQAIDMDNFPKDVKQSSVVKFFINRMNRKWAEDRVFFDQEDYEIITKAYWKNFDHKIFSIDLPEAETSTLVARCRKGNTTVNSALTAAFSGAQSMVEGEKSYHAKIIVAANVRDRIPNPPGEGMGMYAGGVEPKFKYNQEISFWENARDFNNRIQPKFTDKNLFSNMLNWLYLDASILEAIHFKKLGGLVSPDSTRYEKLSAFSKKKDVVLRILKGDNLDTLETKLWGTAVTNLGRLDFPRNYGVLELDRLILQPGGGIPLANVNLVIGAVTCSGKLSLVVEYAEQAVDTGTVEKIKDKAMELLLNE